MLVQSFAILEKLVPLAIALNQKIASYLPWFNDFLFKFGPNNSKKQ